MGMGMLRRLISSPRWVIARKSNNDMVRCFNYCYYSSNNSSSNLNLLPSASSTSSSNNRSLLSSPWLMLPPSTLEGEGSDVDKMTYNFYSLAKNKVISFNPSSSGGEEKEEELDAEESEYVGSSHGWLALFNPRSCDLFLLDPLARRHIKLPPIHTVYVPPNRHTNFWAYKIIITCSPESQECRALMLFNGRRLAYCCPTTTTPWVGPIVPDVQYSGGEFFTRGSYYDIVYSSKHKLLFCLAYPCLEAWDITSTSKPMLVWSDDKLLHEHYIPWLDQKLTSFLEREGEDWYWCAQKQHLIVFDDQLFLVTRDYVSEMAPDGSCVEDSKPDDDYPHKTVGFDVHKIDWKEQKLSYMGEGSLDGIAMFVGSNHSFAVRAAEHAGLKPNSIYFTDHWSHISPRYVDTAYGGHDIGVFDYENKTISPCYYPVDVQSLKRIVPSPMWFTPSPHVYTTN